MKPVRAALFVAVTVLAIAAARDVLRLGNALPWHQLLDFSDFYCAGVAIDRGSNPYTYEPLHRCEHAVNLGTTSDAAAFFRYNSSVAVPAPQPPYDFVPFMALAWVPFGVACILQVIAIVTAVALCAVALAALGVPLEVSAAALALSTAYVELEMGQIVPFALLALVLCGLALARRHDRVAGICAALGAIAPLVGVPVLLAILLFVPRARATVIACVAGLAILSVALLGPHGLFEYFATVLPAHASAELYFPFQYSLSWLLATLGVAEPAAKLAGAFSYFVLLAVGFVLGYRSSNVLQRRELLVFVPALSVLAGGPFLHQEELCFALPALLILATATSGKARIVTIAALCVLSVPWLLVWPVKGLFLASILVCVVMLIRLHVDLRIAFLFVLVIGAAIFAFQHQPPALWPEVPGTKPIVYAANEIAQDSWRDYIRSLNDVDRTWLYIKIPTWAALLAALGVVANYSRRLPGSPTTYRRRPAHWL